MSPSYKIRLHDTLSREEKELIPIEPGTVKIYVCGPTVYDYTHIGHGRTYVVYDSLKRYLNQRGYNVIHVMNITDIDDKIIRRANEEGRSWKEIADEYTKDYLEALNLLGIKIDHHPRVTAHIGEIIEFVQVLIEKGYAYVAPSGSVYFEVDRYDDYGRLSGRLEKELWNQEVEFLNEKKKPYDFALWKAAKPGEPYWESPWGRGRPGWHIECSVMSSRYLGGTFDIHGGGTDLIFPHHENERAQSESFFGKRPWVSIWMHVGLVMVGSDKMSKSLGNIIPLKEALKKWGPGVIRLWYLHVHYRKPINFSDESLEQIEKLYNKVITAHDLLLKLSKEARDLHYLKDSDLLLAKKLVEAINEFHNALGEDFNTPRALAVVSDILSLTFKELQYNPKYMLVSLALKALRAFNQVFGLFEEREIASESEALLNDVMKILLVVRKELRKQGMYALADTIRSELLKIGIQLMDRGLETTWIRAKGAKT
ncbi:MAG: cysteine--tRNA ligase [Desulfurococcaceae archaeon]